MPYKKFFSFGIFIWIMALPPLGAQEGDVGQSGMPGQEAEAVLPSLAAPGTLDPVPGTEETSVETHGVGRAVQMAQEEVRDPFQTELAPAEEVEAGAPKGPEAVTKVNLQGIGFGSQDAYAVLNDDIYYLDEEKKGIKLLAVRRREVDVFVNGGPQTLRLIDEAEIKKSLEGKRKPKEMEAL